MATTNCALGLSLQLLLDLIEKAPVGALGDNLLWATLDHPDLMQPQGVEAYGVLRVILAPMIVGGLLHGLQGVVVLLCKALVHDEVGGVVGLQGADIGRFQNGAQRPFGGHRVPLHELAVRDRDAAKVLGPRAVHTAVDDHVPDLPCPQLLRYRREADQRVKLTVSEEPNRVGDWVLDPVNVFLGIEPHVGGHGGNEYVVLSAERWNTHPPSLQVSYSTHPLGPEKFEAANVDSC